MNELLKSDSFVNSIIGEGTRFSGDLELNGLLRIDGDFLGSVKTAGKVLIGRKGRARCNIIAGNVIVGGVVKGDIHSSGKVVLLSTGMVIGNIYAPHLIAEEGVILDGKCIVNNSPEGAEGRSAYFSDYYSVDWNAEKTPVSVNSNESDPLPDTAEGGGLKMKKRVRKSTEKPSSLST